MKSLSIIFLAMTASFSQVKGQQAFENATIVQVEHHYVIQFSVAAEVNIYQYRIEAGNDSTQMEVTGVVKPKGNSQMERRYRYETFDTGYKYYRVAAVGMGSQYIYSPILGLPAENTMPQQKSGAPQQGGTKVLASGN